MSPLMWFGFGAAAVAITVFGVTAIVGGSRVKPAGEQGQRRIEVRADRLQEIPTDQLTDLAEKFHVLTVDMYTELYIRRTVEMGSSQLEAMIHDDWEAS